MSDTDIYKNREPLPPSNRDARKSRRKRRSSALRRPFDDPGRKRRSKNSGFRRLLHLYRKKESEKIFWGTILVVTLLILSLVAIWQYLFLPYVVGAKQQQEDAELYHQSAAPGASSEAE